MANLPYNARTDRVQDKLRLLEAASSAGNHDLAMSLAESIKDTLSMDRQSEPDPGKPQIDVDHFVAVERGENGRGENERGPITTNWACPTGPAFSRSDDLIEHIDEHVVAVMDQRLALATGRLNVLGKRRGDIASKENLSRQPDLLSFASATLDRKLKQFVERGVLIEHNGEYRCRVFMFEQFLRERSAELITTEFTDQDERTRQEREENETYVTSAELLTLTEPWGHFKGQNIASEHVRAWLDQFETNTDQRLMFQLLKAVRFYSEGIVISCVRKRLLMQRDKSWRRSGRSVTAIRKTLLCFSRLVRTTRCQFCARAVRNGGRFSQECRHGT